mmetsp:Transcript_28482/g.77124  ORF Transcript_28482/g.77124 Transcript_28482/m.77124 type:complete len:375 (+) Transcript_28482:276-1400(+)
MNGLALAYFVQFHVPSLRFWIVIILPSFDSIRPYLSWIKSLRRCTMRSQITPCASCLQTGSEIDLDASGGAPVDVQNDTGAPGTGPRAKVQTGTGHVLLAAHAAQRNPLGNDVFGGPPGAQPLGHAGGHKSGSKGVDRDVLGRQIGAQFLGQGMDGRLGGIVGVGRCCLGDDPDDASHVDDAGRILGRGALLQQRQAGPGQVKDSFDIQIQDLVESPIRLPRGSFDGLSPGCPSIVNQHVQFVVKDSARVLRQFLAALAVGNVRGHVHGRRRDALGGFLAGGVGPGGQQDVGSGVDEILGNHQSDSPGSSRDQDVLARDGKEGIQDGTATDGRRSNGCYGHHVSLSRSTGFCAMRSLVVCRSKAKEYCSPPLIL